MSDIVAGAVADIERATREIGKDMDRLVAANVRLSGENARLTEKLKALTEDAQTGPVPPAAEPEEVFYRAGDRFASYNATTGTHLLCQTGEAEVNLVDLQGGNRLTRPLKVMTAYKIPKNVFDAHFASEHRWLWRKVS
jgi:hypothetical protein